MKTYDGELLIRNLCIRWRRVNFTPWPLHPLDKRAVINLCIIFHIYWWTLMQIGVVSSALNCLLFYATSVVDIWRHLHLKMLKSCTHLYYMTHDNSEISYVICQDDPSLPVNILLWPCSCLAAINTLSNHLSSAGTPRSWLAPVAGDATLLILCLHLCQVPCTFRNCFALLLLLFTDAVSSSEHITSSFI